MTKNKFIIFMVAASTILLILQLLSNDGQHKLKPMINELFEISYKKDSIFISSLENGEKIHLDVKLYYYNNEYYDSKDGSLFMSKKDTLFIIDDGERYKVEIKIDEKGNGVTTLTLLSSPIGETFLSAFYYDSKYKIYKIQKYKLVSYD